MSHPRIIAEAVLRIGEVTEVSGHRITARIDRKKNSSDLLFDGDVISNIAVGSYIEIKKGFLKLIGKVDGERIIETSNAANQNALQRTDVNQRYLTISLVGYIAKDGHFKGGLKELPLIGNQVFLVDRRQIEAIHNLATNHGPTVQFAVTDSEGFDISFPVDGLFNSHIAVFGNTGSGKSNTVARMYTEFVRTLQNRNQRRFQRNVRILLIDFNGEYCGPECITADKVVYRLSTNKEGDRIPLPANTLLTGEILSILSDATEKTQRPFINRTLSLHNWVFDPKADESLSRFRNLLRSLIKRTLQMSEKIRADLILDYLAEIVPEEDEVGDKLDVREGLEWHNQSAEFKFDGKFLKKDTDKIEESAAYRSIDLIDLDQDALSTFIQLMYVQLIQDILTNRALNEHIAPAINKLSSKRRDIEKVFDFSDESEFWSQNVAVVSLAGVNLDMRKTIPLLLAKWMYGAQKQQSRRKSLTIIIDEAHNILSGESFREADSWKDYRLETFEEIIKEGRKFGVFVTISSQRPNDISPTIVSQAHNYFIHRLVNQKDLAAISSAVSYIDEITEASIPTLPTGTCIFSGVAGQMPLKLRIDLLPEDQQPRSDTLKFQDLVPE